MTAKRILTHVSPRAAKGLVRILKATETTYSAKRDPKTGEFVIAISGMDSAAPSTTHAIEKVMLYPPKPWSGIKRLSGSQLGFFRRAKSAGRKSLNLKLHGGRTRVAGLGNESTE